MNELDGFLGEMHKDANFLRGLMGRIKSVVSKNTPTKSDMLKATEKTKNYLKEKAPSKMDVMRGAVKARDLSKNKAVQTTALGVGAYEVGKMKGRNKTASEEEDYKKKYRRVGAATGAAVAAGNMAYHTKKKPGIKKFIKKNPKTSAGLAAAELAIAGGFGALIGNMSAKAGLKEKKREKTAEDKVVTFVKKKKKDLLKSMDSDKNWERMNPEDVQKFRGKQMDNLDKAVTKKKKSLKRTGDVVGGTVGAGVGAGVGAVASSAVKRLAKNPKLKAISEFIPYAGAGAGAALGIKGMRPAVKRTQKKVDEKAELMERNYDIQNKIRDDKMVAYRRLKKAALGVDDIEDSLGIYFDDKLEAMARDKIKEESKKHFSLRNRKWMGPLTLGIGPAIAENRIEEKMIRDLARHYPKVRNAKIRQREHQRALEIARANAPSYTNNTYVRDRD